MKKLPGVLAISGALMVLGLCGTASAERFKPDPSFGDGGRVDLLSAVEVGSLPMRVLGVAPGGGHSTYVLSSDGNCVRTGEECIAAQQLRRLDREGNVDRSFGTVTVSSNRGWTLGSDSKGRPLLVGEVGAPPWTPAPAGPTGMLEIKRFTETGQVDTGFGVAGTSTLTLPCASVASGGRTAAPRPYGTGGGGFLLLFTCRQQDFSGQIASMRLGANGRPVSSYGSAGFATAPLGEAGPESAAVRPNGSAIIGTEGRLIRFTSQGGYDASFAASAKEALPSEVRLPGSTFIWRNNGRLVGLFPSLESASVAELNGNGSSRTLFGNRGMAKRNRSFTSLSVDAKGRPLLFGAWFHEGGYKLFTLRLTANGHRDKSFGHGRVVAIALRPIQSEGAEVEVVGRAGNLPLVFIRGDGCARALCSPTAELVRLRLAGAGG